MSAIRVISESVLCELWRISYGAIHGWRHEGRVASDEQVPFKAWNQPTHLYKLSTINQLHARWAKNFSDEFPLPTVEQLLAVRGTPALLKRNEVMDLLNITEDALIYNINLGTLPVIVIGGKRLFRFPAVTVHALKQKGEGDAVNLATAAKILHLNERTVRALGLQQVPVFSRSKWLFFSRASINTALAPRLVNMSVEEWSRQLGTPLLTRKDIEERYNVGQPTLMAWMREDKTPHLLSPNRRYAYVPEWAVEALMARHKPLPISQLAQIFPAPDGVLERWVQNYTLCGPDHKHNRYSCVSQICAETYVDAHRTCTALTGQEWLARSLHDGALPMAAEDLVDTTPGVCMNDVEDDLANGLLRGVCLPAVNGHRKIVIMRSDAVAWRRKQERRLRYGYE